MKIYIGTAVTDTTDQEVEILELWSGWSEATRRKLDPRLDLRNHSPTGLSWGYGGSGPAQCALAILADALGDDDAALAIYMEFKWELVSLLDQATSWCISEEVVKVMARRLLRKARERSAVPA